ncbi:MAG: hypothetical protein KDE33_04525 [Bacteroidetes bacterium]|nr:hypothetical protein [Bacteroidota bacterium]
MGGPGFAKYGNTLIKESKRLKQSIENKFKYEAGLHNSGSKPLKFKVADEETKRQIRSSKIEIQKQQRQRLIIALLALLVAIIVVLVLI